MNDQELAQREFVKDKDGTTHHASNKANCSKCMDLWIERENKKALSK